MADQKAAAPETAAPPSKGSSQNNIVLVLLILVNTIALAAAGYMLYQGKKKEAAEPRIEQVIKGEHETQTKEEEEVKDVTGPVIPLETFIVNLAGSKGRKVAKVNLELEVKGEKVQEEIERRKPQIRDIIIITLSSKTYEDVSSKEGKDSLRNEIRDTINSFLTKGKITNVFFTEFIYN